MTEAIANYPRSSSLPAFMVALPNRHFAGMEGSMDQVDNLKNWIHTDLPTLNLESGCGIAWDLDRVSNGPEAQERTTQC